MIVGIGGISRSGKTTLAKKLLSYFPGKKKAIIHQDDYINAGYNIPVIGDQIDWEDPDSIDFQNLSYDFHWMADNLDVLILEGLFAFQNVELNSKFDKKILLRIDFKTFMTRKKQDKRWGEIPEWYFHHIWNSYSKFGHPATLQDFLLLDGNEDLDMEKVFDYIQSSNSKNVLT